MLSVEVLEGATIDEAAILVAREHAAARGRRPALPSAFTDVQRCTAELATLLAGGYRGIVVRQDHRYAGVMCGRTLDEVAFFPAHGFAVDPELRDPTPVVVRLLTELAPGLLDAGAVRCTIDHVDLGPLAEAVNNLGFGRGSVFATQPARPLEPFPGVHVRIGTADDLDSIAALSHIEFLHRYTPPIYAAPVRRTLDDTRAQHAKLLDQGAVHLLARIDNPDNPNNLDRSNHSNRIDNPDNPNNLDRTGVSRDVGRDVGLVTIELESPAPRLCPHGRPYIGASATLPAVRRRGVGHALVHAALTWAHEHGHATVSVDFDSSNPLSRPFWLGLGFEPTGYRARRTIDLTSAGRPNQM
jgi:GNAT superfamily N-acetyltransferase